MIMQLKEKIRPYFKDKYYIYALIRENGVPFYIGKGKNDRVNNHFTKREIGKNTRKSNFIRKHFSEVKAEILCYFEKEQDALEYEVWLINYYGLIDEGGVLLNYSKVIGNKDYSKNFAKEVSSKAKNNILDRCLYSEDKIVEFYRLHFQEGYTGKRLSQLSGIPSHYSTYLINGTKHKGLFSKWILSGILRKNENYDYLVANNKIEYREKLIPDLVIKELYLELCYGNLSLKSICDTHNLSETYIRSIFQGNKRKYLNLKISRDIIRSCRGLSTDNLIEMIEAVRCGEDLSKVCKRMCIPKTTAFRQYYLYKDTDFISERSKLENNLKMANSDNKA